MSNRHKKDDQEKNMIKRILVITLLSLTVIAPILLTIIPKSIFYYGFMAMTVHSLFPLAFIGEEIILFKEFDSSVLLEPNEAGAIMTPIIAALIAYIAYDRLNALHSQRYIESINLERREWLNRLRTTCKEYYVLAENLYNNPNLILPSKKKEMENQLNEKRIYLKLLTNPKEEHVKALHNIMEKISVNNINKSNNCCCNNCKKSSNVEEFLKQLESTIQIILKTEWSIIKEETRKGRELENIEKEKKLIKTIYNTKEALKCDNELNPCILKYINNLSSNIYDCN
ncbi:hypothetical protein ATL39_2772 [Sinobaca qinghaiensis]|uniref:Uncharacterized protein n=1 Tax=Sinobaca qinghaiensis TaxID=342944 RepID=A0A419V081_9BACL|nr:hypothetical protein [Sinobaca qinghaiensis]RKD71376.1 hypothetical protein ATL39_2772 [Sinobaca qinghaiensis]